MTFITKDHKYKIRKIKKIIKGNYRIYSDKKKYGYVEIENINWIKLYPASTTLNTLIIGYAKLSILFDNFKSFKESIYGSIKLHDNFISITDYDFFCRSNYHKMKYIDIFLYKNTISHAIFYEKTYESDNPSIKTVTVDRIDITFLSKLKNQRNKQELPWFRLLCDL